MFDLLKHKENTNGAQVSAHSGSNKSLLVLRDGFVTVTPPLAQKILEETHFEGQRPTDHVYVQAHLENINRGLWLDGSPIAFCKVGYRYYLVNGKHRITAASLASKPLEFSVVIYDCKTMDDVQSIYARFDSVQRQRSGIQVQNAFGLAEKMGVSRSVADAVYIAVPLLCNNMRPMFFGEEKSDEIRARMNVPDIRLDAARAWKKQAVIYQSIMDRCDRRLRRKMLGGVMTAMALLTLKHSEKLAIGFFGGVAENDGLRRGDPRHTLVTYMLATGGKKSHNPMWIGIPWNAFYRGEKLSIIRFSPETEVRILGTPIDSRKR